jgi:competence protein ComEC
MSASPASTSQSVIAPARPLFGGYALVAACAAWLAGIALRPAGPWVALAPWVWLGSAAACGCAALGTHLVARRWMAPATRPRMAMASRLLVAGLILGFWCALGAGRGAWGDPAADPRAVSALPRGVSVEIQGDVAAEPILEANGRLLVIQVASASLDRGATWQPATGRIEVHLAGPDDWFAPGYGDTLRLTGKLAPSGTGAPVGVLARLSGAYAQIIARGAGNPILAWLFALRVRLAEGIQRTLPEPEAALLIGILLGLKTPVLRSRLALFISTGTIHLVVPAGLKVSLLAEIARRALRPFGRGTGVAGALLAVIGYAALGGGGPAAVRAAIMGALLALAPALGRRYDVYAALALAALALTAIEPLLVFDAGFQLTMLATLGIPLLTPTFQRWLTWPLARVPRARLLDPAAELLAVTLAAQVATLPVLALTFGQVSLVAPLANLLAVPLLAPLLVLGAALAGATLAGPALALPLAFATWPLLWLTDVIIAACAGIPSAAIAVAGAPLWAAWAYYIVVVSVLSLALWHARRQAGMRAAAGLARVSPPAPSPARPHRARIRWALAGLSTLILLTTCGAAVPAFACGGARIDFLDVGPGGAATLVRLADGTTALIDGGPSGPALEEALASRMPFWQRSLDLALLTDPRPGDTTGLQDAAGHFAIGRAADAGMLHPTSAYLAWLDALARAGTPHARVRQDDVIQLSATTSLRVLAPPQTLYPPHGGATTASNDAIVRLDTPGLRVLLLGGADAYALDALAFSGEPLAADVVEVALPPNVGLDLSGPLGIVLLAAHPRLVVIAQAPPLARSHQNSATDAPWPPDAASAAVLGATIVRTSSMGTVTLAQRPDGGWDLEGA